MFEQLTSKEVVTLANHEAKHIDISLGVILRQLKIIANEEAWVNKQQGCDIRPVASKYEAYLSADGIIPQFMNMLMTAAINLPEGEKLVFAMDTALGKGVTNDEIKALEGFIEGLKQNNPEAAKLLDKVEMKKGEGAALVTSLESMISKGSYKAQNIVAVTNNANLSVFTGSTILQDATVAGIDDSQFPEKAYYPFAQIAFFALGKHLGLDAKALHEIYENIPNVVKLDIESKEFKDLSNTAKKQLVIRLVPDAQEMDKDALVQLWESIQRMYKNA